ncbi:SH3 domain-containing protein [Chryseobacterium kwangjuense]|uniref:SH3 domain-containing protein n=1 Tax=Chryseobacterium kwangjuense TaxID=267125 RepID=UPI0009F91BC2|nr:SH3 domain-containing protein [Chryseobacterium kwangjuense]
MKPILIITIILSLFSLNSCFKANDNIIHEGKCTGSANCTACSNCSRCGHCGSGGTCGVCSSGSSRKTIYTSPSRNNNRKEKKSSKTRNPTRSAPTSPQTIYTPISVVYYAKKRIVNIRRGPGIEFPVIEKIKQGSKLIKIEEHNDWIKVKIKKTGTEGFVYYKDIKN